MARLDRDRAMCVSTSPVPKGRGSVSIYVVHMYTYYIRNVPFMDYVNSSHNVNYVLMKLPTPPYWYL